MTIRNRILTGKVPVKIWTDEIDQASISQLEKMSKMPFVHKHIAVMPDVHLGKGATIGSVIPTKGAIIPASVGVDIGCGMMAVETNLTASDLPESLRSIRLALEEAIPHGRTTTDGKYNPLSDKGLHKDNPDFCNHNLESRLLGIISKTGDNPRLVSQYKNYQRQIGTLGTGNHFLELCLDKKDKIWVMLHTGSRGIGNSIGSYFIEKAKEDMRKWFINLPDKDLSYFVEGTDNFNDYVEAVSWGQDFAKYNRVVMMNNVFKILTRFFPNISGLREAINCHHNYIEKENHYKQNVWVTRKGAIRARKDDLGIIPGSMGARSFIVKGLGNKESFCSCSHGAVRKYSRTEAKKIFSVDDLKDQTNGVECRKDADVIDEIPSAYKDIDKVMENQNDLVTIEAELKQILCIKG